MIRRASAAIVALAVALTAAAQWQPVHLDSISAHRSPEGIWRMAPTGTIFEIKARPGHAGSYTLEMHLSPDLRVSSGTAMGGMTEAGKAGVYDARLRVDPVTGSQSEHERSYTLTLDGDGRLTVKPYSKKLSVNLNRLLPYMFRFSVRKVDTRPDDIDAAYRLTDATEVVL